MEPCPLAQAAGWMLLLMQMWGGVGRGRESGCSVPRRVQGRSNPELGFLGSLLYKRQDAVEVAWPGHSPLPPWKEQKGKGRPFVGSQGSGCFFCSLLDALLQPAFYRGLASPIVSALQEGGSREALNNFNFQKVGKKRAAGRAREEGRRKRFKTICSKKQSWQARSRVVGGRKTKLSL